MDLITFTYSLSSVFIVIIAVLTYFYKIKKNKVPVRPIGLVLFLSLGIVIGGYANYLAFQNISLKTIPIILPAIISIFLGLFFLWILTQRKTPIGNIKVKVGDSVLPFTTKTSAGNLFTSKDFNGKRILFKFFRGSWCPYCSAELMLFDKMKSELQKYEVNVVALSGDNVEEAAKHKVRDSISFTLLVDPELDIIKQYGVEHQKALGADSTNTLTLFGIVFPVNFKFKSMSIPTSILIDENGVVKWIDQSEDYRLRASEEVVLNAVKSSFSNLTKKELK